MNLNEMTLHSLMKNDLTCHDMTLPDRTNGIFNLNDTSECHIMKDHFMFNLYHFMLCHVTPYYVLTCLTSYDIMLQRLKFNYHT